MYQLNTTNFNMLFYCLGQHVSTLKESSSGPSKIQILYLRRAWRWLYKSWNMLP